MTPFEFLKGLDKFVFLLINHDSTSQFLDPVMIVIRDPFTWIPLYIFISWFIFFKVGKKPWLFVWSSLATVAITDSCSYLLKNAFARITPCYDASISALVRHVAACGGAYSFPSNHASNHFGLAAFWFWSILKLTGKKWKWLWLWAAVICYAQIYVGKQFPSDIIVGAFLGICTGTITAKIFELLIDSKLAFRQTISL